MMPRALLGLPVVFFIVGVLLPPEISIKLGGLRLSGYRLVLLVTTMPCLYWLVIGGWRRINAADGLILFHALWVLVALGVNEGLLRAIESGGVYLVESVGAYLLARRYIQSYADYERLAKLMFATVCVLLVLAIPEALTGLRFIREAAALVGSPAAIPYTAPRMGLHRVFGPFDHPILYGVYCACALSMVFYLVSRARLLRPLSLLPSGLIPVATALSVSGGPLLALLMQMVLIGWERATSGFRFRWLAVVVGVLLFWVVLDLLSNRSPVVAFISNVSFSSHSAYTRVLIFEYGSAEALRNPFFGIGFGEWARPSWMPESVDNFWLITAMRFGLPALVSLGLAIAYLVLRAAYTQADEQSCHARRAWAFTLAGLTFAGCTVAFWNSLFVMFFFLMGCGAWLSDGGRALLVRPMASTRQPTPEPGLLF